MGVFLGNLSEKLISISSESTDDSIPVGKDTLKISERIIIICNSVI